VISTSTVHEEREAEWKRLNEHEELVRRREILSAVHAGVVVKLDPQPREGIHLGTLPALVRRWCAVRVS
jgi:hypothetical protein